MCVPRVRFIVIISSLVELPYISVSVIVTVNIQTVCSGGLLCRHYRLEAELLAEVNWRVRWDDITSSDTAAASDNRKAHTIEHNGSRYARVSVHVTAKDSKKAVLSQR